MVFSTLKSVLLRWLTGKSHAGTSEELNRRPFRIVSQRKGGRLGHCLPLTEGSQCGIKFPALWACLGTDTVSHFSVSSEFIPFKTLFYPK